MKPGAALFTMVLAVSPVARADPKQLDADVNEHMLEILARNPERRDDAFSKMGGSSVASKAFLNCFSTEFVELGEHADLADTIAYFGSGRRNSFNRQSKAAGVSWNLRYVLGGRPAHFREELADTQARWALVLFGGNDAQNENERVYLTRLVYLVEQLEEMGVVPILGSASPRRNRSKDRWIRRFNLITEAVARHWSLPYIDYHGALSELPRQGLARDGVHPNVLPPGGFHRSCQLTDEGLRYGNNVRNLLTLQMLDTLRRASRNGEARREAPPSPSEAQGAEGGLRVGAGGRYDQTALAGTDAGNDAGTDADVRAGTVGDSVGVVERDQLTPKASGGSDMTKPLAPNADPNADVVAETETNPLPLSFLVSEADLSPAVELPRSCGSPKRGSRHYRVPLELGEPTRLRASALDLDGRQHRIFLVRNDAETGPRCVRRRTQTLEVDARPGMWDLIVEVAQPAAEGQMLVLIARDPR